MEYNNSVNTSAMAEKYLKMHPSVAAYHYRSNGVQGVSTDQTVTKGGESHRKYPESHDSTGRHNKNKGFNRYHKNKVNRPSVASDYDDINSYSEGRTIPKHNRHNSEKQASVTDSDHQLSGYYDYNFLEDDGVPSSGSHQLSHTQTSWTNGNYPRNRQEWHSGKAGGGGGGRSSPYEAHMRYPSTNTGNYDNSDDYSIYGMGEPYMSVASHRYPMETDDQVTNWDETSRYRIPYKRSMSTTVKVKFIFESASVRLS